MTERILRALLRLAPTEFRERYDAELQVVVRRLQEDYPETNSVLGPGSCLSGTFWSWTSASHC